ncbi:aldehyde dehydrogenase [Wolfiporia cocos MD-104 SS10]|uniref:Aldehyde dehydrogenase n=1 Tax=Wolfiporia cocos (strain MD-104) TaxID=742152 RepID=A0A2H3K6Y1_WOLCO|nr:aldehyde dehydrogenase [Wolfiporia cocos MD-104 SS10]
MMGSSTSSQTTAPNGSASAPAVRHNTLEEIDEIYARLTSTFRAGTTRPLAYRRAQLLQLARMLKENLGAFEDAFFQDLGKPRQEVGAMEVGNVLSACLYAAEHLEGWTKPEKPEVEEWRASWDATIYRVPKGVVLIIGPWNYPSILTLGPLVGAIAAGCTCVIKGSELVPALATLLASLLPRYLDSAAYAWVNGAVPETRHLLARRWDHVLFTGSGKTGRIVARTAAEYVTPVTLELGGKSPVVIAEDADIEIAAKRVLFGKAQNSGQLCVSPDHVYVPRALQDAFTAALLTAYRAFWPQGPLHPDAKWGKIVNPAHHARLRRLLERSKGTVVIGGEFDGETRIAPTIVRDVKLDDALMEEELFGPILPIIPVESVDEALEHIRSQPSPLVIYAFTSSEELKQRLLDTTYSGTLVLNDTTSQLAVYEMPFGGEGDSGHGRWYGKYSFDTFTNLRSFTNVPPAAEPFLGARYLPYTDESYAAMTSDLRLEIPDA